MTSLDDRFKGSERDIESLGRRQFLEQIKRLFVTAPLAVALGTIVSPEIVEAQTRDRRQNVQIQNLGYVLNTSYQMPPNRTRARTATDYIILHTTEGEFQGSLNKIRRNANAHYLIDRNGVVYSIVPLSRWANHAGRSMWEGHENISNRSIGIEIVGYHYGKLTEQQYDSMKPLVQELQKRYGVGDRNVLAHFQVAYAVNRWTRRKKARGRRKDGINIDWSKINIDHRTDDPDVKAGRVLQDPFLQTALAGEERNRGIFGIGREDPIDRVKKIYGSNIIDRGITAWTIAGDEYDQPTTFYVTPNNVIMPGNKVKDWTTILRGTRVYTNTDLATVTRNARPIITLAAGETVWSNVQSAYNDSTTCYVAPGSTKVIKGDKADFMEIGPGTRIVLDCTGPHEIDRNRSAFKIADRAYNTDYAIYIFPNGDMRTGRQVINFNALPRDTSILVRRQL